jgi:RNA polymerase sigma-70 factor (ECF subfamily)
MDANQFKSLFLPLHTTLYRIAYSILRDEDDAKDIVQDTYLKLWNKRDDLSTLKNRKAFCITLLRNQCIDFIRSNKKQIHLAPEHLEKTDEISVSKEIEVKDSAMHMQLLIEQLPERQRQIVMLREIHHMSISEISKTTHLSAINIRATLSKARGTLRNKFTEIMQYGYKEN